jgi:uncharacterized hydrophobic protein (TIGR00271 family)
MAHEIFVPIFRYLKQKRAGQISLIDRENVIKTIYADVEISAGYFLVLSLSNLIALCGLIVNSAPVIIGAMLISPLMEPILSVGFAFLTGNRTIWRLSLKKIILSLVVTLMVAGIATWLSPLQETTNEILSRSRPNLYDLIIALLAGLAGAVAICTKKNLLTIIPGVAIATAVIPPLSVAGFGIGTGSLPIFLGGFFLFFTNFVAIVFVTGTVLIYFGFTPTVDSYLGGTSLRKRILYLSAVILIISIPLIYTLHESITLLRLQKLVQTTLKQEFDREGISRLSNFTQKKGQDGKLQVDATISTTKYLSEKDIGLAEKQIIKNLKQDINFRLEQIKVQPGGLRDEPIKPTLALVAPQPRQPVEIVREARRETMALLSNEINKINTMITPAQITDFTFGINSRQQEYSLELRLKSDSPLNEGQTLLLEKMIGSDLGIVVRLQIRTFPFIPELLFSPKETALSEEMKKSLLETKEIFTRSPRLKVIIISQPENSGSMKRNLRSARERAESISAFLTESCAIPADRISAVFERSKSPTPKVKVSIIPEKEQQP